MEKLQIIAEKMYNFEEEQHAEETHAEVSYESLTYPGIQELRIIAHDDLPKIPEDGYIDVSSWEVHTKEQADEYFQRLLEDFETDEDPATRTLVPRASQLCRSRSRTPKEVGAEPNAPP